MIAETPLWKGWL